MALVILSGCGSEEAADAPAAVPSSTTVAAGGQTAARPSSRETQQVDLRTEPACQGSASGPRESVLAGDIYVRGCRQTVIGYDLVRQTVAWTRPLAAAVLSLSASDAVVIAYVDRSVAASGLTATRRSIVAVGLSPRNGEQLWDHEVAVSSTYEPRPKTHAQAKVAVLPVAGDQYTIVDAGGAEKWRLPPLVTDVQLVDNGKLVLATTTSTHPSSGNRVSDDLTNVYDAESGKLLGRVPDVDTEAWSGYGLRSRGLDMEWIELRTGKVLRQLRSKTGQLLHNSLLEHDYLTGTSRELTAISETGATRWTIPATVVADFAVIEGRLFVTNRSEQIIEVSEETGAEVRRWDARPASIGTGWAVVNSGAVASVRPID